MVVVVVVLFFEGHEIDEKSCGEQCRFEFDVEVDGESDGEVVRLRAELLNATGPHFVHRADLSAVESEDLEKAFVRTNEQVV